MGDTQIKEKKAVSKSLIFFLIFTAAIALLGIILSASGSDANSSSGVFLRIVTFTLALMPILLVIIVMIGFKLSALRSRTSHFYSAWFWYSVILRILYTALRYRKSVLTNTWGGITTDFTSSACSCFPSSSLTSSRAPAPWSRSKKRFRSYRRYQLHQPECGMVGMIHMVGVFVMPWLIMMIAFGKGRKRTKALSLSCSSQALSARLFMFLLSNSRAPSSWTLGTDSFASFSL